MDEYIYPASLVIIALLTFIFYQNNNTKLALLMLLIGIYIVYSNETGYTATDFKNSMINSINEETEDFVDSYGLDSKSKDLSTDIVK